MPSKGAGLAGLHSESELLRVKKTPRMKKKTERKRPPELDPILPLPAGTGIPYLREGEGREILNDDRPVVISMTRRAAYIMWEQAEALAKKHYQQKIDGPFANHANAVLEACYGFRNRRYEDLYEKPLPKMSEERARKARKVLAEMQAQEAREAKKAGKGRKGSKNAENEPAAANPEPVNGKKIRCSSTKDGNRCIGPIKHSGKHKDKYGNRWA